MLSGAVCVIFFQRPFDPIRAQPCNYLSDPKVYRELYSYYRINYICLSSECALLVRPCHLRATTWTPPPTITCRRKYFPLFSSFVLFVRVYPEHGTAGEPGAVAGVGGRWRVEGGLKGARSPISWLGVAYPSRHEGRMNGICLASWCGVVV